MTKHKLLPLSLAALMVSQVALANITKIDDQTYELKTCNFPTNAKYDFSVSNGLSGGNRIGQDNCLKYTFRNGSVSPGDNIKITVNGVTSSETVPGHKNSQSSQSQNSNYSTTYAPMTITQTNQSQPPVQTQPTLPSEDLTQARQSGKDQAKNMADRVVKTYATAERSLYSFYIGLQQGVANYNGRYGSLSQNNDYAVAEQTGLSSGNTDGRVEGSRQGTSEGTNAGSNAAATRFHQAVGQTTRPTNDFSPPKINNAGWEPNISQPKSLQQLLSEKNAQFIQILNGMSYGDEDYTLQNPFTSSMIDLGTLYSWGANYQFNSFINSYGNADWAFDAWRNRTLGGHYQKGLDYFDRISDSNRVMNSSQAVQEFTDGFKNEYVRIINERYVKYVQQVQPLIANQGVMMGEQAAAQYVEGVGQYNGYKEGFSRATGPAYNATYGGAFLAGAKNMAEHYESNVVVTDLDAVLVPAAGQAFLPGLTLNLVINKVVNAGEIHGQVPVSISGQGVKPAAAKTIDLQAHEATTNVTINGIGGVAANAPVETSINTTITVDDKQVSTAFVVKVSDVVTALSNVSANPQATAFFNRYVTDLLTAEWKQAPDMNGKFYTSGNSVLEKLVKTYAGLNQNQKNAILALKPGFVSLFGTQPSKLFHHPTYSQWTLAQGLLAQLK